MFKKCLVLLILLSMFLATPSSGIVQSFSEFTVASDTPLVESRLKHEVALLRESTQTVPALLEFEQLLSSEEILRAESMGVTFARRGSSIVSVGRIYSAHIPNLETLDLLSTLGLVRATSGNKQYVPSLSTSVRAIGADDVWDNLKVGGQSIDGSGVTVAVLDTGATWLHPAFWKPYPSTFRFILNGSDFYLDLNGNLKADPGEGPIRTVNGQSGPIISYGSDYMYLDVSETGSFNYLAGDRWIAGVDENSDSQIQLTDEPGMMLNISKIAVFYDQYSGSVYTREANLTSMVGGDSSGHGTHVASTIAGGQPGFTSFVGVAPGADLIIIRSPLTSSAILDGIAFAVENDADVINMSFSSYLGFLDGTDLEDLAVNEAFLEHGVISVAAAGNLGDKPKHARFSVPSASSNSASVQINDPPDYSYVSVLWHSEDRDEHIILSPPSGDPIDLGQFSTIAGKAWALDTVSLSCYVFADISMRGMNNIIIQVQTDDHFWENGVWGVSLENPSGAAVTVDVFGWDGGWGSTNVRVTSNLDYHHTISSPGTADLALTVACYSETGSNILSSSSRGPRIDGAPKPSLAAPGNNIHAANNAYTGGNLWTHRSGTSMASPHVAGAVALVLQALPPDSVWLAYSSILAGAGGISSHWDEASPTWGHGLCDTVYSVMHILNSSLRTGASVSEWIGVQNVLTDPVDSGVLPSMDLLGARVLVHKRDIGFAITLAGKADFSGDYMLSIEWDADNNLTTGVNGAEIVVNITGGIVEVYEWNGSLYQPSELDASWWNQSEVVFVRLSGFESGLRGRVSIATHNSSLSYVDLTSLTEIPDYFRPLFSDVVFSDDLGNLSINLVTEDVDTIVGARSIGWAIVDGSLRPIDSGTSHGVQEAAALIDEEILDSEYANSIVSNVTSEGEVAYLPPVPLTRLIGFRLQFTSGALDKEIVTVGLLSNDVISGRFTLNGFNLAEDVYVAFRHQTTGRWLNFSLSSNDGVYEFVIGPSSFSHGAYDVFAIAIGRNVPNAEMRFATLTIVQDAGLMVVGVLSVVIIAAIVILRRLRGGSAE